MPLWLQRNGNGLACDMLEVLAAFNGLSFLFYGLSCLFSSRMRCEFARYGLARFRVLTGALQLAGATGMLVGLSGHATPGFLAAGGLALQMAMGVGVRVHIRDRWYQALPALGYGCLNAWLAWGFYTL